MKKNGLVSEKAYPYVKKQQRCTADGTRYGKDAIILRTAYCRPALFKALLARGPIATRVLYTDNFMHYKGGNMQNLFKREKKDKKVKEKERKERRMKFMIAFLK